MMIQKVFLENDKQLGYRQIKMLLTEKHGMVVNHKRIRRSMQEQGLYSTVRRRRVWRGLQSYASYRERAYPNIIKRKFSPERPQEIYSADVTEVRLPSSQRVFMHMVKDLATREIVSYNVSTKHDATLVTEKLNEHFAKLSATARQKLIYHTDQGGVFMCDAHKALTEHWGVTQSMSRRGAPIESFFGHMKDEVPFNKMKTVEEVKRAVKKYVNYYNNERPQWSLNKMTPAKFRSHLTK